MRRNLGEDFAELTYSFKIVNCLLLWVDQWQLTVTKCVQPIIIHITGSVCLIRQSLGVESITIEIQTSYLFSWNFIIASIHIGEERSSSSVDCSIFNQFSVFQFDILFCSLFWPIVELFWWYASEPYIKSDIGTTQTDFSWLNTWPKAHSRSTISPSAHAKYLLSAPGCSTNLSVWHASNQQSEWLGRNTIVSAHPPSKTSPLEHPIQAFLSSGFAFNSPSTHGSESVINFGRWKSNHFSMPSTSTWTDFESLTYDMVKVVHIFRIIFSWSDT